MTHRFLPEGFLPESFLPHSGDRAGAGGLTPPQDGENDYGRGNRCRFCKLSPSLCLCDRLRSVNFPVRILIVQHWTERKSISNTGSLLPLLLDHAEVLPYAHPEEPFDPSPLQDAGTEYRLLYPHADAEELSPTTFEPYHAPRRDVNAIVGASPAAQESATLPTLVVLDGTWPKAQRMTRRVAALHRLPAVCLPLQRLLPDVAETHGKDLVGNASGVLRQRHLPERLSTLESVLQALAAMGHRDERLEHNASELLRRRLHLMGRIPRRRLGL